MNMLTKDRKTWFSLPFLMAGACLPVLDTFVVSTILPTLRTALDADAVQTQLVASVFSAVYSVLLITGSRLGDLFGRKRLFVLGGLAFAAASAFAASATSIEVLLVARAAQGLSAALLAPQVLASIQALVSAQERPPLLRALTTAFSIAGVLGSVLGGLLIAWHPFGLTWQALFAAYVPLGLLVALGALGVPESKNPHAQGLDPMGVVLLSVALALLVIPLSAGRAAGWPWWSFALLGAAPVAWALFGLYEHRLSRRGGSPLVSLELFRDPAFVKGLLLSFALYVAYGFLFCFTLYLKAAHGLTPLEMGLACLPFTLSFFAVSFFVGTISQRLDDAILPVGFTLLAVGWLLVLVSLLTGGGGLDAWTWFGFVIAGLGNGLVIPSLLRVITGAMDPRHAGLAAGVLLSVQQMGSALGVVLLGGLYFSGVADPGAALSEVLGTVVVLGVAAALLATTLRSAQTKKAAVDILPEDGTRR